MSSLQFEKAVSFDGDGLSDVCSFIGTQTLSGLSFKISNVSGSGSNISIDTAAIKWNGKPVGFIAFGEDEETDELFTKTDINDDGKVDEKDLEILKKLATTLREHFPIIEKYFGITATEL